MKISLLEQAFETIGGEKTSESILKALVNDEAGLPATGTEFVDAAGTLAVRLRTNRTALMPDDPDKPWF